MEFTIENDRCYIDGRPVSKELFNTIYNAQGKIASIVSPDAPTITNEHGGSQSDVDVRFDLIDAKAMFAMAGVLDHGAKKYGANNWRLIPVEDHLNHLLMHTFAYLAGDTTDDHLSHILCRATFACGVALA
jgi:dATP/dGTP diphosphohydrolase